MCTKEGLICQKRKGIQSQTHAGIIQYVAWMHARSSGTVVVDKFDASISIGPIDN